MKFETKDGLSLHYEIHGQGNPIFCLPGLTRNSSDFLDLVEAYHEKAMIISLTFRGRDPSGYDQNWQNYNIHQEGLDCLALLDHLNIEKPLWLGTSRGGLVSMKMAHQHKDRMAGVILNDIGPDMELEGLSNIFEYLGVPPSFSNADEAAYALQKRNSPQFPTLTKQDWEKLANRFYRFDQDGAHLRYDPKIRDALLAGSGEYDFWNDFHALEKVNLGLIWGENSNLLAWKTIEKMKDNHPEMLIAKIPDRGHVPFLNETASLQLIDQMMEICF